MCFRAFAGLEGGFAILASPLAVRAVSVAPVAYGSTAWSGEASRVIHDRVTLKLSLPFLSWKVSLGFLRIRVWL